MAAKGVSASTAAVTVDYAPTPHTYVAPTAPAGPMPCVAAMAAAVHTMQRGIQDDLARQESNRSRQEADMTRRLDNTFREQNEDLDRRLKRSFREIQDDAARARDHEPKRTRSAPTTAGDKIADAGTGQVSPKKCLRCDSTGHGTWKCPVPCPECGVSKTGTHINGCKFISKKSYHQVAPPNTTSGATKNAQGRS